MREVVCQATVYRWETDEVSGEFRRERRVVGTVWGVLVELSTEERTNLLSTYGDVSYRFYTKVPLRLEDEVEINGKTYRVVRVTSFPKIYGGINHCALLGGVISGEG